MTITRQRECPIPEGTPFRAKHTCWARVDEYDQDTVIRPPTSHWGEFVVEETAPVAGTTHWELVTTRCDGTSLRVRVTSTGKPTGLSLGKLFVGKPRTPAATTPGALLAPTKSALPSAELARVAHPQVSLARGAGRTYTARCIHCPWEYTATRKTDVQIERDQHLHAHRTARHA